jgi:hypothetical protein
MHNLGVYVVSTEFKYLKRSPNHKIYYRRGEIYKFEIPYKTNTHYDPILIFLLICDKVPHIDSLKSSTTIT